MNRFELAIKAKTHTEEMERKYEKEISEAVKNTKIYNDGNFCGTYIPRENMKIEVDTLDSVSSIFNHQIDGKMAVLNFADYMMPGGCFLSGEDTQEESLCHESFLFNVLREFEESEYDYNMIHIKRGLYRNWALYTPDVIFERNGEEVKCDVITCAAPNRITATQYRVDDETYLNALKDRISFATEVAAINHVDTLILGAFGCGAFGNDARIVAETFKEELDYLNNPFENVIFSVYDRSSNLYKFKIFEEVFIGGE